MKTFYSFLVISALITNLQGQTWTKISGVMDNSQVKGVAVSNNRIIVSGQNWASNTTTDFGLSEDGGNTWNSISTFDFASTYPMALPQNNLIINSAFISTKKLVGTNWQNFSSFNYSFAEFSNGTIIGGNPYGTDTLYYFNADGVRGNKLGDYTTRLGFKYFNSGNNNRFFVCSTYFCFIDQNNPAVKIIPETLDGNVMTELTWQLRNIVNMVKTSNGTLIAIEGLGYGIMKSTDNGLNWTTTNAMQGTSFLSPSIKTIAINANDDVFIVNSNKIFRTSDYGVTFTDVTGNLQLNNSFITELFVSNNNLYCILNANGEADASKSGIYKAANVNGVNDFYKTELDFKVYPNPSSSFVYVDCLDFRNNSSMLEVTNTLGQIILSKSIKENETQLNLSNFKKGIYYITLKSDIKKKTQKLIIN